MQDTITHVQEEPAVDQCEDCILTLIQLYRHKWTFYK